MQHSLNVTNKKNDERILLVSFCVVLFLPALNNFVNCFSKIGLGAEIPYLTEACYILMVLLGGLSALRCFTKNMSVFLISVLIIGGCWLSYSIYPEMRTSIYDNPVDLIYNPINKVTFFCIPALIYTFQISSYDKLFALMVKWARITLLIGVITFYYVYFIAGGALQYMVFSYFMLTPICICFENYMQNHKKSDIFLSVIGFLAILLCGARGAILSFFLYFIIRLISYKGVKDHSSNILMKFILGFILLFVVFFWENTLVLLYNFTNQLEIESRFITALIEGTLNESSGRDVIADAILKGISNNPLGYGLFGDRYVAGTFGYTAYTYAHNFFLEVICSFGIVIGSLLIIIFFDHFFKAVKRKDVYYNRVLWSLIPYGFFQLFFSSSAIENVAFYMICALIFAKKMKRVEMQ